MILVVTGVLLVIVLWVGARWIAAALCPSEQIVFHDAAWVLMRQDGTWQIWVRGESAPRPVQSGPVKLPIGDEQ